MFDKTEMESGLTFVGEVFARICRRGHVDVLMSEVTAQILHYIRSFISSSSSSIEPDVLESHSGSQFWLKMIQTPKDAYAVERMLEQLLLQLATERVNDVEAYWIIWLLFHKLLKKQTSVRALFIDKFLLWKVFPVCCLRWILQFAVFECPPHEESYTGGQERQRLLDTVQRLVTVWSKREFVQSAPLEQQAYVTAAMGLLLEKKSKEELDGSEKVMPSILLGVSCRLESPADIVRKMAGSIALAFSKVIDPENPLYLDDSLREETIDWVFGFTTATKGKLPAYKSTKEASNDTVTSLISAEISSDGTSSGTDKKLRTSRPEIRGEDHALTLGDDLSRPFDDGEAELVDGLPDDPEGALEVAAIRLYHRLGFDREGLDQAVEVSPAARRSLILPRISRKLSNSRRSGIGIWGFISLIYLSLSTFVVIRLIDNLSTLGILLHCLTAIFELILRNSIYVHMLFLTSYAIRVFGLVPRFHWIFQCYPTLPPRGCPLDFFKSAEVILLFLPFTRTLLSLRSTEFRNRIHVILFAIPILICIYQCDFFVLVRSSRFVVTFYMLGDFEAIRLTAKVDHFTSISIDLLPRRTSSEDILMCPLSMYSYSIVYSTCIYDVVSCIFVLCPHANPSGLDMLSHLLLMGFIYICTLYQYY